MHGDFATCARELAQASALDPGRVDDDYDAAACHARMHRPDDAFRGLERAVAGGYHDLELMRADPDLAELHDDPRWATLEQHVQAQLDAYLPRVNGELYRLVTEDQKERVALDFKADWSAMVARDAVRLHRVKEIVAAGGAKVSEDFYAAALVAQHGEVPADFQLARDLALKAAELDPKNRSARWLAAAATDRELVRLGKLQKYGTQSHGDNAGIQTLYDVDPAVSDDERARWFVPALADKRRMIEAMNAAQRR